MIRTSTFAALIGFALSAIAQDAQIREDEYPVQKPNCCPCPDQYFSQNVYFDDTHLYTTWSAGAGMAVASLGSEFAYRAAPRDTLESQTRFPFRLIHPPDIVVVAENVANMDYINRSDLLPLETEPGRHLQSNFQEGEHVITIDRA